MKIRDINPWWKTGKVQKKVSDLQVRDLFDKLKPNINKKQIIAINGLRRTGKTVLMHHLINYLLESHKKENIFYYNFDLFDENIENLLKKYEEVVDVNIKEDKIFVLLDEIQKHENWENEIKILYDNYPNIKFFISGSSSLFIEKKTKESLAGRVFSFTLQPMTFKEYLKLRKVDIPKNLSLYEDEMRGYLDHYMKTGGFPELINEKSKEEIDRYIKELVVDRVSYIDIPGVFEIEEPELFVKILSIISSNPGVRVNYENLSSDLGRNRKTISNYVHYLEKAFLVKRLYNFSKSMLKTERKLKKVYPTTTALSFLFDAKKGKMIENVILMNSGFDFFKRKNKNEVDFIKTENKNPIPVESKYKKKVKKREIKPLLKFMQENKAKKGIVITKEYEEKKTFGNKTVEFIPLWKWLLK